MTEQENKKSIKLFVLVTAFYWFSMYAYIPTFSPYIETMGASHKLVGLILGSYGFTQMLVRIPLGIYSDRINKRKIFVIIGIILSGISTLGMYLAQAPELILFFRALAGVSAATWISFTVLFSSYFADQEAARAIGIINASNKSGQVLGMLLGGVVAQLLGQRFPFLLAAGGGVAALFLSLNVAEKSSQKKPIKAAEIIEVAKNRSLLLLSLLAIIMMMIVHSTAFGFIPVVAKKLGAGSFQLGLLTTITTLPGILSSYLSGSVFTKKYGEKNTVTTGFILLAVSCLLVPLLNQLYLLYFNQILNGFAQGMILPILMGLSIKNVAAHRRGTAMGFFQAIYGLGMFAGPLLVGTISDFSSMKIGFLFIGCVGLLGACLSRIYQPEVKLNN